jgi:Swiss Army Knife RNA repair-like protein
MKNTFLFLDYDGVLNSNEWCWTHETRSKDPWAHIDPSRVEIMNTLVAALDCKVVISSTYRILHLADLRFGLTSKGATFGKHVVGKTDRNGPIRGAEIARWVEKYPDHKLVIIDDSMDMGHLMPYLVRTNPDTGIVMSDIDRAIKIVDEQ